MRFSGKAKFLSAGALLLMLVWALPTERAEKGKSDKDIYIARFDGNVSIKEEFEHSDPREFLLIFARQMYSSMQITFHGEPSIVDKGARRTIVYRCSGILKKGGGGETSALRMKEVKLFFFLHTSEEGVFQLIDEAYRFSLVSSPAVL